MYRRKEEGRKEGRKEGRQAGRQAGINLFIPPKCINKD
jgi:predicted transposase YdaD